MPDPAAHAPLTRLGPSWRMAAYLVFFNPLTWVCWLLVLYSFCPPIRNAIYQSMVESESAMLPLLVWFHHLQKAWHFGGFALALLAGIMIRAVLIQLTTRYEMRPGQLILTSGILVRYADTVSQSMVFDCDIRQNLFQAIFGSGDLLVRTVEQKTVWLRFVPNPARWRDQIMANCAAQNLRMLGTV